VAAREGRDGGYRLARPAEEITLADVFCAIHHVTTAEAAQVSQAPGAGEAGALDISGVTPLLDAVGQEVERQALTVFQRYTIAALATQTTQPNPAN
jgi:DNA-binding IscR family transcriptional regulator